MNVTRRQLMGAGAAAAFFPWLREARAATPAKKLLLFFTPHGTVWNQWRPTGGETGFSFSPILKPLEKHRDKLVIAEGISLPYGTAYYVPHTYTMPSLWTGSPIDTNSTLFSRTDHMVSFGWGTGVSIDQAIANSLNPMTFFKTIELGTYCGGLHPANRMIYSAPGQVKSPIDDPSRAFTTIFGTPDPDQVAAAKRLERRKSVLDTVVADMGARKATLSAADKTRLDAHATSVRELERRLAAATPMCTRPGAPANVNTQTSLDRQIDLIAAAFGCGITTIASLQTRIADNDNSLYEWLQPTGLDTRGHHTRSHDSSQVALDQQWLIYRWYSERFSYLLDKLATTPDPNGGMVLDNTLVIWGSELGTAYNHDMKNLPWVFAGGTGTKIRGGRYLKFTNQTNHRVLVSAHHHMGLTNVQKYGSLDTGTGPLTGILG